MNNKKYDDGRKILKNKIKGRKLEKGKNDVFECEIKYDKKN
jgi:hypothetical protein